MNSLEKYEQEKEQQAHFPDESQKIQDSIYYLQRKLREKGIAYSSRKKYVFATSDQAEDKHVKKLLNKHNFTVQTIID